MGMLYEYDSAERQALLAGLRVIDNTSPEEPMTPEMSAKVTAAWKRTKALMPPKGGPR